MKKVERLLVFIFSLVLTIELCISLELYRQDKSEIQELSDLTTSLQEENTELKELQTVSDELIQVQSEFIDELLLPAEEQVNELSSRGTDRVENRIMEVSAYDLSVESCGKPPGHPEYGITASGKRVQKWHTIAAGPELTFGTQIYIPYFKDMPNGGIFVVEDRGGAIKNGRLDVYIEDNAECFEFGRRELEVYILDYERVKADE